MALIDRIQLKNDFIGTFSYEKLGDAPRRVNGQPGTYQRHLVHNEKHGRFHIITPALPHTFEFEDELVIDGDCFFLEDTSWNGNDVAPAINVLATNLKRVGGHN